MIIAVSVKMSNLGEILTKIFVSEEAKIKIAVFSTIFYYKMTKNNSRV